MHALSFHRLTVGSIKRETRLGRRWRVETGRHASRTVHPLGDVPRSDHPLRDDVVGLVCHRLEVVIARVNRTPPDDARDICLVRDVDDVGHIVDGDLHRRRRAASVGDALETVGLRERYLSTGAGHDVRVEEQFQRRRLSWWYTEIQRTHKGLLITPSPATTPTTIPEFHRQSGNHHHHSTVIQRHSQTIMFYV